MTGRKAKNAKGKSGQFNARLKEIRNVRAHRFRIFLLLLAIFILVAIPIWRFYIATNLKNYLVSLAETHINGKIDFDSIQVNPITGRVRIRNASVKLPGEDMPVIEVPEVSVDVFKLREQNIDIVLEVPTVRLVRERDGLINLQKLVKPAEEEKAPTKWNIELSFNGMFLYVTDNIGIPPDTLAKIRGGNNALASFEKACAGLGVKPVSEYNPDEFEQRIVFERLSGILRMDAEKNELACSLTGLHKDSKFSGSFRINRESGDLSASMEWGKENYALFAPFIDQLTPFMSPLEPTLVLDSVKADIAGTVGDLIGARIACRVSNVGVSIPDYPRVQIDNADFIWDTGSGLLQIGGFNLSAGDALADAFGTVELGQKTLDLTASVAGFDLDLLPVEIPVAGTLAAKLNIGGAFDDPVIHGWAGLSHTRWENHDLGAADADFTATLNTVSLERFAMGGGEIVMSGSGLVTTAPSAEIDFSLASTPISTLAKYMNTEIPASGRIAAQGKFNLDPSGNVSVTGKVQSPEILANEKRLESVRTDFQYDGEGFEATNLSFNYRQGGDVAARTVMNIKSGNLAGEHPSFTVSGKTSLPGVPQIEVPLEGPSSTDIVGLFPEMGDEDLFYDPNAPKKGVVILSTDPSRIGEEVWWPRLSENETGTETTENEGAGVSGNAGESGNASQSGQGNAEPGAPGTLWLREGVLSHIAGELSHPEAGIIAVAVRSNPCPFITYNAEVSLDSLAGLAIPTVNTKGTMSLEGLLIKPIEMEFTGSGALNELKLYLSAGGRYKKRGYTVRTGYQMRKNAPHEFDLYLLYGNSDFTVKGTLDPATNILSADVLSEAIQLEDLLDLEGIYGTATLSAKVGGTINSPRAKGDLLLESAEYESSKPPYPIFEIREGRFPFTVDLNEIKIENGAFSFGNSTLSLAGRSSKGEMSVTLTGSDFSLESFTKVIAPDVTIEGKGDLVVRVAGTLRNPEYSLDFGQDDGSLNDIPFGDAELVAVGDVRLLDITKLHLGSDDGDIDAKGRLSFEEDRAIKGSLTLSKFQIGLVSALFMTGGTMLDGLIDGSVEISGTLDSPRSNVELTLSDGKIQDQEISADLQFSTEPDRIVLDFFELYAGDSTVLMNGVIRDTIAESQLEIEIPYLDLSLLNHIAGFTAEEGFWGAISITTRVKTSERGPYMAGSINGSDDLGFGRISLASMDGAFDIYPDMFLFKEFKFSTKDSVLVVDGRVPIKGLSEAMLETLKTGKITEIPVGFSESETLRRPEPSENGSDEEFSLNLRAENFSLEYVSTVLPDIGLEIGGTVTANMNVSGAAEFPVVSGTIDLAARDIRYLDIASVGGVEGEIFVEYDPDLASQKFSLGRFVVTDPETSAGAPSKDGKRKGENSDSVQPHTIEVGGGGTFRLKPFTLYTLDMSAILSNFERFQLLDIYKGPVEGELFLGKELDDINVHIGGSITLERGGTITLQAPDPDAPPAAPLPITIGTRLGGMSAAFSRTASAPETESSATDNGKESGMQQSAYERMSGLPLIPFKVYVKPGVSVRFPPVVDIRAEIEGAKDDKGEILPLKISGHYPDISMQGKLESYKGSLIVHRHTFRVVDPPFEIRFDPMYGLLPYLKGKAAVVIPGGARGSDSLGEFSGGFDDDLTIYVSLDCSVDDLSQITLTSEPPLSEEEIKRRMLGVLPPEGSVQGLTPEIRDELYNLVGARVSRLLEDKLNIEQLTLRIGEENELYIDVEKYLSANVSVLYSATLFGNEALDEREKIGLRYLFLKKKLLRAYIEAFYDNSGSGFTGNEIRIVLRRKF
ncbi:hypothetical protein J7K50_08430 [bacterium]|nr:hypothetical protein [bacterium]